MIVDSIKMKQLEKLSSLSPEELMEEAGAAVAAELRKQLPAGSVLLFLCGKGNNGGDGFVSARLLAEEYACLVCLVSGEPATDIAKANYDKLPETVRILPVSRLNTALKKADLVIDAVYGIGFHLPLSTEMKKIFRMVNNASVRVHSVDINSGCESDTGRYDTDALCSEITYALGYRKPFHALRKHHEMFKETTELPLSIPLPDKDHWLEMDEERFFAGFPKKGENAFKGTYGKTLLVGGSYGMAGALGFNILGAKTVGASYIQAALPQEIYPILAGRFLQPVYYPFGDHNWQDVLSALAEKARACAFGSGAVHMTHKHEILDLILQNASCPVILDAEALNLLKNNYYFLKFVRVPVILTPHIGEFSNLIGKPAEMIQDNLISIAKDFASENHVYLVLKGPHTIVVSPSGDLYINESGNQALAQAGSGDLLTGIMAGMLTMTRDVYRAVCMAVWLHGYLADLGIQENSAQNFDLEQYPELMNKLFKKHGF
ncbi:MAG: NAD(P)H-hydrate dehydratase [Solobacterium sp.]|nr:NAD(P)H-hydrate dehydratase [Solobacterium sp.]